MNNQKTLKKVLEELNKDNPRLDYIRGILEVLIGEDEDKFILAGEGGKLRVTTNEKEIKRVEMDEASIMEAETRAFIAKNGMPNPEIA